MVVIQRLAGAVSPGAGAVVMAGGVVSVCFAAMGASWPSWGQVVRGAGDEWVLGGALAISTLAGATLLDASVPLGAPDGARTALRLLTVCLALVVWLVVAAGTLRRVRDIVAAHDRPG